MIMYVSPNFPSKKAFKEHVAAGKDVDLFQPGLGSPAPANGKVVVEGPHYPKPHSWNATVKIVGGKVVSVK
jgi:hypothetical protein